MNGLLLKCHQMTEDNKGRVILKSWFFRFVGTSFLVLSFQNCGNFDPIHVAAPGSSTLASIQNKEGEALYMQNCAACHQTPPDAQAYNANFDEIKAAILVVSQMQHINLDNQDVQYIADYLNELANPTSTNPHPGGGSGGGGGVLPPGSSYTPPSNAPLQKPEAFGASGLMRLTKKELILTVEQNLQISVGNLSSTIPEDSTSSTHFANDYTSLPVTQSLVNKYVSFAEVMADKFSLANFSNLAGCSPRQVNDRACFETFVQKVGRRFFRRPLSPGEITKFSDTFLPYAVEDNDFMSAVGLGLQTMLLHPEFLYRKEVGTTNSAPAGLSRLSSYEIATRLSFFLTGRGPDDFILDAAANGQLDTSSGREALASELFKRTQVREHWSSFHGMWLGYEDIILDPNLNEDMRLETHQLLTKNNFIDQKDWLSIFDTSETYLTPALANHYSIGGVNQSRWVATTGKRGGGLLSHGTFAAIGRKFNDTSPTLRGYEVFKRLLCGEFSTSIPTNVDTNLPPGNANDCKTDRYAMRALNNCASCHSVTDGIGFALENIDGFGRIRDRELDKPQCQITGQGDYESYNFTGPKGLGSFLKGQPKVGACGAKNVFEFLMGRKSTTDDQATLDALEGEYFQTRTFLGILKSIVRSPGFIHKRSQ